MVCYSIPYAILFYSILFYFISFHFIIILLYIAFAVVKRDADHGGCYIKYRITVQLRDSYETLHYRPPDLQNYHRTVPLWHH